MIDPHSEPLRLRDRLMMWTVLVMLVLLATACGASEYRTPIGGGYQFCRFHGEGRFILGRNDKLLVPPNVVDLEVVDGHAVGRLAPPESLVDRHPDRSGYFIANLEVGTAELELTEAAWQTRLVEVGLPENLVVDGNPWRFNTSPAATFYRWTCVVMTVGVTVNLVLWIISRKLRHGRCVEESVAT